MFTFRIPKYFTLFCRMQEQKRRRAIIYGDEINPLRFDFQDKDIQRLSAELEKIKSFMTQEINQENFQSLCDSWYNIIDEIPFAAIPVDVEWLLRARPNFDGEIFEEDSDISYNTKNVEKIKANRFNRPEESVFYAVLPSDNQTKFVAGASLECYKDLINEKNEEPIQYLTFGKWHFRNKFSVINLCFEAKALEAHPGLKKIVDSYLSNLEKDFPPMSAKFIKDCWFLLSELSSTRHTHDQQYFITTAFFCVLEEYYKINFNDSINGIMYPSSMVYSDSINVVLKPEAVDKYLYLKEAFMYKFVRDVNNKKNYSCGVCSLISQVANHKLNIKGIKTGYDLY